MYKGVRISKPPPLSLMPKIIFIEEMPRFMHKQIEWIVNVKDDGSCGFWVISNLLGKGEKNNFLVCKTLLKELMLHREFYTMLYKKKENFDTFQDDLNPCVCGPALFSKWMCFPEIGYLIASAYDRMCIDLIRYTFMGVSSHVAQECIHRYIIVSYKG
ncbi:uncharacterized protein LOC131649568 [Vicia villosa]|uniref:uncharacterized protein LOC131649568 n=1 Tax=Vicia villosa TaxID=3911 RepID=UPI00273C6C4D|nr:uncharacterized protein LOC131649568 [Vicia villosa]